MTLEATANFVAVRVLRAMAVELAGAAAMGERLQHLPGRMIDRHGHGELMAEAQHLDLLVQHIHGLGAFCAGLSGILEDEGGGLNEQRVGMAAAGLDLAGLAARLTAGSSALAVAPASGECELW